MVITGRAVVEEELQQLQASRFFFTDFYCYKSHKLKQAHFS